MLQATDLQHWSRGTVLDSSRMAFSGDSEMIVNDLRAQSTLSSLNRYSNHRTFDLSSNTYLTLTFSPFHSVHHGRQELSTRLEAYGEGIGRPCCSEEDPRQRETSGDRITRGETRHASCIMLKRNDRLSPIPPTWVYVTLSFSRSGRSTR
jgi:hypothetical protein